MIGRLIGKLADKKLPSLLIDIQGVGYEVSVPLSAAFQLPELGHTVTLHTHFVVREDAQLLYGFITEKDRELFRSLIKVNGIGPKTALAILSNLDSETFAQCIVQGDIKQLSRTPGIGKKTAERLVVEMRDKLFDWQEGKSTESLSSNSVASASLLTASSAKKDAIDALIALGYSANEVSKLINQLTQEHPEWSSDALIRAALKKAG